MNLYAFHLEQTILTVLGQVTMAVKVATLPEPESGTYETSETDHTLKRRFCHGATCRTMVGLAILRCLRGSEMVLLGVVVEECETPTINVLQENGHGIL